MTFLSRNKIYHRVGPSKDAKKLYIFCEGQDKEIQYFKYFQGLSSNIEIIPIPNVDGKSDPIHLMKNAELIFFGDSDNPPKYVINADYKDEIWFVIDTDRWNECNKIGRLIEFCELNNSENNRCWFMSQSNPSFEIWLYYHFFNTLPIHDDVTKYSSFKDFVNFSIPGGFDSRKMPIHIKDAIKNAKENYKEQQGVALYTTTVYLLGEIIYSFAKDAIMEIVKSNIAVKDKSNYEQAIEKFNQPV